MSGLEDIKERSELENQNNKEDNIHILLLSKDLINTINSINENQYPDDISKEEKKDINNNYLNLSENQNDEDLISKQKEQQPIFDFHFNKNEKDEKENVEEKKDNQNEEGCHNENIFPSILFDPPIINSFSQNNQNFAPNHENPKRIDEPKIEKESPLNPQESPFLPSKKNNLTFLNNNNIQNQKYVMNSCFTMNGKTGWICSECKNFNYEGK